ncbi:hypothetical protein QE152_g31252 [Popillia japonica]|uniref:Integrase catalytic domain-containing protein n=1 Tax=Popillia japonica TaxID=7064 RepID=A0AAW1JBM3_POPJA
MPLTFNKANQQQIKVKDGTMPRYTKSYRYPHIHKEEVRKQKWHMVNDYRKLNKHTNADALSRIELNPLEKIENIINDLEGENDLLDTINSNMEYGPPNSIPIQEEVINNKQQQIHDFMKGYLQPNRKYYIMFDLEETYKQFYREYCKLFGQNGPKIIRCTKELEVVEDGIPKSITMDNGTEFVNRTIQSLLRDHKIQIHTITPHNPQSNGIVERFHGTLLEHLRILVQEANEPIPNLMKYAIIGYNNNAGKNQEACGPDVISVYGLCLQTSALDSNPHEITGKLAITTSVKIVKMHCSCKAGNSGRCKHVSAFLIKCIREDVETLGNISQTEKKCVWSTQKNLTKDKYRAVPINEMACLKKKIQQSSVSVNSNEVLQYFCNKLPTSAIAKHKEGHREEPIATTSAIAQGNIISRSNLLF